MVPYSPHRIRMRSSFPVDVDHVQSVLATCFLPTTFTVHYPFDNYGEDTPLMAYIHTSEPTVKETLLKGIVRISPRKSPAPSIPSASASVVTLPQQSRGQKSTQLTWVCKSDPCSPPPTSTPSLEVQTPPPPPQAKPVSAQVIPTSPPAKPAILQAKHTSYQVTPPPSPQAKLPPSPYNLEQSVLPQRPVSKEETPLLVRRHTIKYIAGQFLEWRKQVNYPLLPLTSHLSPHLSPRSSFITSQNITILTCSL